jgi:hypothetical protein
MRMVIYIQALSNLEIFMEKVKSLIKMEILFKKETGLMARFKNDLPFYFKS